MSRWTRDISHRRPSPPTALPKDVRGEGKDSGDRLGWRVCPHPNPSPGRELAGGGIGRKLRHRAERPSPQPLSRCAGEGLSRWVRGPHVAWRRQIPAQRPPVVSPLPRTGRGAGGEGSRSAPSLFPDTSPCQPVRGRGASAPGVRPTCGAATPDSRLATAHGLPSPAHRLTRRGIAECWQFGACNRPLGRQ